MTEPTTPPSADPRSVRADEAADKARAKAMRPWYQKKRVIIPLALFALLVIIAIASPKDETDGASSTTTEPAQAVENNDETDATDAPETTGPTAAPQWVEVASLDGNTNKRGDIFNLPEADDIRMRWLSDGGFFAVYVMKKGDNLEEQGGIPETTCTEQCADETRLAKSEGEYYLDVKSSSGTWRVVIEVMR